MTQSINAPKVPVQEGIHDKGGGAIGSEPARALLCRDYRASGGRLPCLVSVFHSMLQWTSYESGVTSRDHACHVDQPVRTLVEYSDYIRCLWAYILVTSASIWSSQLVYRSLHAKLGRPWGHHLSACRTWVELLTAPLASSLSLVAELDALHPLMLMPGTASPASPSRTPRDKKAYR